MKRIITTRMNMAIISALFCLLTASACGQTTSPDKPVGEDIRNEISDSKSTSDACTKLGEFLVKELSPVTKQVKDSPRERLYGLQQKDAMAKALGICIKLKAEETTSASEDIIYNLPDNLGKIVIHTYSENNMYLRMTFETKCALPFNTIHFVSNSYANSK